MANPEQAEVNVDNDSKTDTIPAPPIIERGHAHEAVRVALANVAKAIGELEAVASAVARGLDEEDPRRPQGQETTSERFRPLLALLACTAAHHVVGCLS